MWYFITTNISTINGIVLLFTLIAIILYTYETRKMRISNEKNFSLLEEQNIRAVDKENKRDKLARSYILSQVEVLITAVADQIIKVEKFIEDLKQEKIINLEFSISVDFNTRRIRIINLTDIFEMFVLPSNNNSNHLVTFNSFLRQLDFIDSLFNSFNSSFNYILEHFGIYESKWNDNMEIIGDLHDKWLNDLRSQNINPRADPFLNAFFSIYQQWATVPDRLDMYIAVPNLIVLVLQKARETQPNVFGEAMFRPLLRSLDAFDNHKNLRKIKLKEYEMYKDQLKDISSKLASTKTEFSSVV